VAWVCIRRWWRHHLIGVCGITVTVAVTVAVVVISRKGVFGSYVRGEVLRQKQQAAVIPGPAARAPLVQVHPLELHVVRVLPRERERKRKYDINKTVLRQ
jgi:hypothetical protein